MNIAVLALAHGRVASPGARRRGRAHGDAKNVMRTVMSYEATGMSALTPGELHALGYSMILYPTSLLFRAVRAIERIRLRSTCSYSGRAER